MRHVDLGAGSLWRAVVCAGVAGAFVLRLEAGNWPAWRGDAEGSGRAQETRLPLHWSATQGVRWKVALPDRGNSTPVVWGGMIFLTQVVEAENRRAVLCLDRKDGRQRWQSGVVWSRAEETHETNPYCSASPVTDGERVIAWFGSAGVVAYDFQGRELWRRDLGEQKHEWGYGSSPILWGNLCFLFFGPGPGEALTALDKRTGEVVWQAKPPGLVNRPRTDGFRGQERGGTVGSFASPIVVGTEGREEVVMTYAQWVCGYDPRTGRELWRCDGLNELVYTSPIAGEGVVVGMGGFFGTSLAVRAGGQGDVTQTHRLWQTVRTKNRLGSGVVHQGHVYILNTDGIAECLELRTGRTVWEERLPSNGPKSQSWSSLLLAGDTLFVPNQSGEVIIFKASPTFEVVRANSIGNELTNASLATSDGELYLRTHDHLWCIGPAPARPAGPASGR